MPNHMMTNGITATLGKGDIMVLSALKRLSIGGSHVHNNAMSEPMPKLNKNPYSITFIELRARIPNWLENSSSTVRNATLENDGKM
jgi:hypothetical protein